MSVKDTANQSSVVFGLQHDWRDPISGVHVYPSSAETLVRRGGITNHCSLALPQQHLCQKLVLRHNVHMLLCSNICSNHNHIIIITLSSSVSTIKHTLMLISPLNISWGKSYYIYWQQNIMCNILKRCHSTNHLNSLSNMSQFISQHSYNITWIIEHAQSHWTYV